MKGNHWATRDMSWYLVSQLSPLRGCAAACRGLYHNWKNAMAVRGNGAKNGGRAPVSNGKVSDGRMSHLSTQNTGKCTSVYKSEIYFETEVMILHCCFEQIWAHRKCVGGKILGILCARWKIKVWCSLFLCEKPTCSNLSAKKKKKSFDICQNSKRQKKSWGVTSQLRH